MTEKDQRLTLVRAMGRVDAGDDRDGLTMRARARRRCTEPAPERHTISGDVSRQTMKSNDTSMSRAVKDYEQSN